MVYESVGMKLRCPALHSCNDGAMPNESGAKRPRGARLDAPGGAPRGGRRKGPASVAFDDDVTSLAEVAVPRHVSKERERLEIGYAARIDQPSDTSA